jgi:hypothetical protein
MVAKIAGAVPIEKIAAKSNNKSTFEKFLIE